MATANRSTAAKPTSTARSRSTKDSAPMSASKKGLPLVSASVKKDDHPLASTVPPYWLYTDYIQRTIDGVADVEVLRMARKEMFNTIIFGPTGPGKTSCVKAFAASTCRKCSGFLAEDAKGNLHCTEKGCDGIFALPVVTIECNGGTDASTFYGSPAIRDGRSLYVESQFTVAVRTGAVIYFDEVNFLTPRVTSSLHGLTDKRRAIVIAEKGYETVEADNNCQVIATYNDGYEGTRQLNEAFKNRFQFKMHFDYDRDIEDQIINITALLDLAANLRDSYAAGELETPTSTNMLMEFEGIAQKLSYEFAVTNFVNAFGPDERESVRNVVGMFKDAIKAGLDDLLEALGQTRRG